MMTWTWKKDIYGRDGSVYLTRYRFPLLAGWAILLHIMRRPDEDRCLHDHPWWFISLVLWGGYWETVETPRSDMPSGRNVRNVEAVTTAWRHDRFNRPGALLYRPALHTHRVAALPRGKAVTLVLRGPAQRTWGFRRADGGWIAWDAPGAWQRLVSWCREE